MESPFVYGKIATEPFFTDRAKETALLVTDFQNLTNTILISPRRWGKSSLVRMAANRAIQEDPALRICHVDIFNVRTEEEFYQKLATEILRGTASLLDEIVANAKRFLSTVAPTINIGDTMNTVGVSFQLHEIKKSEDEILDLAEKIAVEKGIKIVVCIDEFQQIASFKNSDAFQAKLRSHWQLQQHVAYCLYGSRRHMMLEVFTNVEKPFYKFGKTMFLEKIKREHWPGFIAQRFRNTGKDITPEQCLCIVDLVDNNPYYIQQLCEEVWNRTTVKCDDETIDAAFRSIVDSQSGLNLALTQTLSITQQNLLNAIVQGEKELTSSKVMEQYDLRNSLTVQRAKNALAKLDIIDTFGKTVSMEDPIYAFWLKNNYFRR